MKKIAIIFTLIASVSMYSRSQDIVDTAIGAGSFNTLVTAVQMAGLEEALRGEGPFTVFAPTDDAFAKIPGETLNALLDDTESLQNILLYHVVAGSLGSGDVVEAPYLNMLSDQVAPIEINEDGAFIAGSKIVVTDIETSNGIIHVLDTVMLPPSNNLVETAVGAGIFNTLVAAVQAAGLVETLADGGPFTVFAPTDDAFAKLPDGTIDALLADPAALTEILLYHVIDGRFMAADVLNSFSIGTLQGSPVRVNTDGGVFINDSGILATDILATNGVVHVIDTVLLPPKKTGTTYRVEITNLTRGQVFSPPGIVSHSSDISLFELGQPASDSLAALAEDGSLDKLVRDLSDLPQIFDISGFDGPILPGMTASATVQVDRSTPLISVAGMLTSTNDSFFAVEMRVGVTFFGFAQKASTRQMELAWAYDAGTEANNESCEFIPGFPCGSMGMRDEEDAEGYVYFASGVQGNGDLNASEYDWNGPVAQVKISRQ